MDDVKDLSLFTNVQRRPPLQPILKNYFSEMENFLNVENIIQSTWQRVLTEWQIERFPERLDFASVGCGSIAQALYARDQCNIDERNVKCINQL